MDYLNNAYGCCWDYQNRFYLLYLINNQIYVNIWYSFVLFKETDYNKFLIYNYRGL